MYSSSGLGKAGDKGSAIAWFARMARKVTTWEYADQKDVFEWDIVVTMPTYIIVTILDHESYSLAIKLLNFCSFQHTLLASSDVFQELAISKGLAILRLNNSN